MLFEIYFVECFFRNVLGTRNLGDILSEREAIASEMQQGLDSATAPWGVLVERVEVDNFIINIIFINIINLMGSC